MPGLEVSQRAIEAEKKLSSGVIVPVSTDLAAFCSASTRFSNGNWMIWLMIWVTGLPPPEGGVGVGD
jgi:hypothetical protein